MPDDDRLPSAKEIITIHEEIAEQSNMTHSDVRVAAPTLHLREILERVASHDDVYGRGGALLRHLITGHVFEDGNKRTAWTATWIYLERHGCQPAERDVGVERVLRRIRRYDVDEIAEWLASGQLDRDRLDP